MSEEVKKITEEVKPVFSKYGVKYAGLFGSYSRGDHRPDSDIDIMISFGKRKFSLFDLIAIRNELSLRLKKTVDIISEGAVIPYFRDYIYRDIKTIYEE